MCDNDNGCASIRLSNGSMNRHLIGSKHILAQFYSISLKQTRPVRMILLLTRWDVHIVQENHRSSIRSKLKCSMEWKACTRVVVCLCDDCTMYLLRIWEKKTCVFHCAKEKTRKNRKQCIKHRMRTNVIWQDTSSRIKLLIRNTQRKNANELTKRTANTHITHTHTHTHTSTHTTQHNLFVWMDRSCNVRHEYKQKKFICIFSFLSLPLRF